MSAALIRRPQPEEAAAIAAMHVASWRETYRGRIDDAVLDDPDLESRREQFWIAALTDERYAANRVAIAEADGTVIGVAMSGRPLREQDCAWPVQLYVLYVLAAAHGSGVGDQLLAAVLDPGAAALLWVADPNPRAQAFYRRHRFAPDGAAQREFGLREIRMVRGRPRPGREPAQAI